MANWLGNRTGATPTAANPDSGEQFRLPTDLREWFDPWRLREWVEEEILRLGSNSLSLTTASGHPPDYRPGMMLALLSFAYLTQVFSSDEIVHKCDSDAVFRSFCAGKAPFAHDLSSFRRRNRDLLETIIAGAFHRGLSRKFDLGLEPQPPGLEQDLRDRARERLDLARHMDVS